jgi:hypothetical protein
LLPSNKVDLLVLTHNRLRFTQECLLALQHTDWSLVNRVVCYEENSTDGTRALVDSWCRTLPVPYEQFDTQLGSPIAVMKDFLERMGSPLFAKIDSDVVVPPEWLNRCVEVMAANPELSLLGIEPVRSRTPSPYRAARGVRTPTCDAETNGTPSGYVPCGSIGGIGLMRRSCFQANSVLQPYAIYGGFTTWQLEHPMIKKGWIAPALKLFLLDRLPIEPWKSLSEEYIKKGWQRPWTNYELKDKEMWDWWFAKEAVCN